MDITGPDGKIKLRVTYDADSFYENEDENISEEIESYFEGEEGQTWKEVAQDAANYLDWDDEAVINFEAESELSETSRDYKKMEFFNSKGEWELVPEEVENWYYQAEERAMNG